STMPKATPLVSPRVGFRWNMTEDRSSILRGGAGIFTGRIPFVWISNSFSNTGVEFAKYQFDSRNPFPSDFAFNANVNNQPTGSAQNSTEINLVSKDFKFPQVFRANLAYEQMLPFGVKATIEGLYTKNLNDINLNNLVFKESGSTLNNGGDDRPIMERESSIVGANGQTYTNVLVLENTSKGYTWNMSAKLEKTFDFGLDLMAAYTIGESKSVNSGTSSVAYSNWQYNETRSNPNKSELSYSDFDNRHRIIAAATYSKAYAKYFKTSVSLMYSGNTGSNYSVIYNGDINGDGVRGNDLMYVPTVAETQDMNFKATSSMSADAQRAALNQYIDGHKDLSKLRGKYAERNAMHADFEHHFDVRIAQDFDVYFGKRKNTIQLSLDILNIGNLFNRSWGMYHSPGFNHNPLAVTSLSNGTPEFQFTTDPNKQWIGISDYNSRWRMQLGVKYIF
ncbi:MAG: TonB-dependent receptor, partial [Bacteroidales bacterium]